MLLLISSLDKRHIDRIISCSELPYKISPKIHLPTIAELLSGKKIDMPPIKQVGATFKKAERFKGKKGEQLALSGEKK